MADENEADSGVRLIDLLAGDGLPRETVPAKKCDLSRRLPIALAMRGTPEWSSRLEEWRKILNARSAAEVVDLALLALEESNLRLKLLYRLPDRLGGKGMRP